MRNLWLLFVVGLATGFISEKLFVSSQTRFTTADDMYLEGRTSGDLPIDDEDGDDDDVSGSGSGDYDFRTAEEMLDRFLNFSQTNVTKEVVPAEPQPTAGSTHSPSTTAAHSQDPSTTVKHTETTPVVSPAGDEKDKEVMRPDWSIQSTTTSSTSKTAGEITATTQGTDTTASTAAEEDNSLDNWDVTTPKKHEEEVLIEEFENDLMVKNGKGGRIFMPSTPEEVTSENMWERTEVLAAVIACGVVGFLCAVFLLVLLAYRMKKKDEGSYDLGDTKVSTTAYHKAPTKEFYA